MSKSTQLQKQCIEQHQHLLGKTVSWLKPTRYISGGPVQGRRTGTVIAICPANQNALELLPEDAKNERGMINYGKWKSTGYVWYDRAIVQIPRANGRGFDYYAPPIHKVVEVTA